MTQSQKCWSKRLTGLRLAVVLPVALGVLASGCASGGSGSVGALPAGDAAGGSSASPTQAPAPDPELAKLRSAVDALGADRRVAETSGQLSAAGDRLRALRGQSQTDLAAFYDYNKLPVKDCAQVRSRAATVAGRVAPANAAAVEIDGLAATMRTQLASRQTALDGARALADQLSKAQGATPATLDALTGLQTALKGFDAQQSGSRQTLDAAATDRRDVPPVIQSRSARATDLADRCRR